MLKFIAKQSYSQGFKRGLRRGFKEGHKRGKIIGSKGLVKLNLHIFDNYSNLYKESRRFAVKVNSASFKKYNPPSKLANQNILSRGCLYKIGERAVILHNSILSLCEDGWASVTPIILRSLLECFMSSLVIAQKDSEYMAFKFYVHDDLNMMIDKNIAEEIENFSRTQINQLLKGLSSTDQKRASKYVDDFLKRSEPKSYWYRPEYKDTKAILNLCTEESGMPEAFRLFSMSTHGTFLGSQLFKDQPDETDINPRPDPQSIKIALAVSSSILIEIASVRDQFEKLGLDSEAQLMRDKKLKLRQPILDSIK